MHAAPLYKLLIFQYGVFDMPVTRAGSTLSAPSPDAHAPYHSACTVSVGTFTVSRIRPLW